MDGLGYTPNPKRQEELGRYNAGVSTRKPNTQISYSIKETMRRDYVMCVELSEHEFKHKCSANIDKALSRKPKERSALYDNRSTFGEFVVVNRNDLTGYDYRILTCRPCFNDAWQLNVHPAKMMVGHYHDPSLVFLASDFIRYCQNDIPFKKVRSAAMLKARAIKHSRKVT